MQVIRALDMASSLLSHNAFGSTIYVDPICIYPETVEALELLTTKTLAGISQKNKYVSEVDSEEFYGIKV